MHFLCVVTVEDNSHAVNLLKDAGIQANASFVIGSPDETLYRILKALPFSPWRRDVPKVLAGVMIEYMARLFSLVKKILLLS